jgi:hypothetical protein
MGAVGDLSMTTSVGGDLSIPDITRHRSNDAPRNLSRARSDDFKFL